MDIAARKLKRKSQVRRREEKLFQKVSQGQLCSPLNAITKTRWAVPGCRLRQRREERGRERAFWISGGVSQKKIARQDLQQARLKAGGAKPQPPSSSVLCWILLELSQVGKVFVFDLSQAVSHPHWTTPSQFPSEEAVS